MITHLSRTAYACFVGALAAAVAALALSACGEETVAVPYASPAGAPRVSDAALEQFVFRAYVDLVGTAPTAEQLAARTADLRAGGAAPETRAALVDDLQTGPDYDSAYALNLYQGAKAHFLENFPDAEIERAFVGLGGPDDDARLRALLAWPDDYLAGAADLRDLQRAAVYNLVYDRINMGSFNLVRATFDNLLWRFPTDAEFAAGFEMVERGEERELFGFSGSGKADYVDIVVRSEEALEGIVIWQYELLLARRPTAAETLAHLDALRASGDVTALQRALMQSDEYARL